MDGSEHVSVERIVDFLGARLLTNLSGTASTVHRVSSLFPGARGALSFAGPSQLGRDLHASASSVLLVHPEAGLPQASSEQWWLVVQDPRLEFARVATHFFHPQVPAGISADAYIDSTATIGEGSSIAAGAFVGRRVQVGKSCSVGPNAVLLEGTVLGDFTSVGPNSTIGHVGFGYSREPDGEPVAIPHFGAVSIGSHVDIGANVCIDRGTLDDTVVEDHVKIDNLVHIAHNCRIELGAFVIATAILCGGVRVGPRAWISPNASVRQQLSIGADAQVGLGSTVTRNVPDGATVVGSPAREIDR